MEKLIKPVEYAHQMGISRQAVYAKIKRGILQSKSVDGKLYIVLDENGNGEKDTGQETENSQKHSYGVAQSAKKNSENGVDYETLLRAKDETISVLKDTVSDLKESNRQMSTTLRGEIDLLKEAFHEMRTLYISQIEHIRIEEPKKEHKTIEVLPVEEKKEHKWIPIEKFFKKYDISKKKKQKSAIKILKKAYKNGDTRISIDNGEIRLQKKVNFEDLIE